MIDPSKPVALVAVPTQRGRIDGSIVAGYAYVRWDSGGGNNVPVENLMQTKGTSR